MHFRSDEIFYMNKPFKSVMWVVVSHWVVALLKIEKITVFIFPRE